MVIIFILVGYWLSHVIKCCEMVVNCYFMVI